MWLTNKYIYIQMYLKTSSMLSYFFFFSKLCCISRVRVTDLIFYFNLQSHKSTLQPFFSDIRSLNKIKTHVYLSVAWHNKSCFPWVWQAIWINDTLLKDQHLSNIICASLIYLLHHVCFCQQHFFFHYQNIFFYYINNWFNKYTVQK